MKIGGRDLKTIIGALLQKQHYIAATNMFFVYKDPMDAYARYLFHSGDYPTTVDVTTPIGGSPATLYSHHDILTVNEIFCRQDYKADRDDKVIVDFGSNIGISALYFLTRATDSFTYLFEPVPQNVERLRGNLAPFQDRYALQPVAVGLQDGTAEFGFEETGRYGGLGLQTGHYMTVECVEANRVLREVIARHGAIDILKIDIESLEREITEAIAPDILPLIRKIYVELNFGDNPLAKTHTCRQYGGIAQFERL
ncbi:MAG TPA: FkbM family methyltransferase [Azospirillaceae bacterium]|nr:FkbM family methyltransferase [Azospirillaceae bacterium]